VMLNNAILCSFTK